MEDQNQKLFVKLGLSLNVIRLLYQLEKAKLIDQTLGARKYLKRFAHLTIVRWFQELKNVMKRCLCLPSRALQRFAIYSLKSIAD